MVEENSQVNSFESLGLRYCESSRKNSWAEGDATAMTTMTRAATAFRILRGRRNSHPERFPGTKAVCAGSPTSLADQIFACCSKDSKVIPRPSLLFQSDERR